ncbi:TadE/TadG family type IV pilus assembly protein [Bradyrhizobium erythrophlei]|uniref:Flp pilus assembly protein TadG n=1 Tax=Bradyrhizobium erythrophlei TaxID=1437360 RepID=A0A1H4QWJ9_9BRAD|nr:TadE/TadG family type IV pilus assembly protein [Bradyrhizobium erythrophlei]SEC24030.1 Flp pilus assembly protein TadG [Bradyrhizobium erythrophlei]
MLGSAISNRVRAAVRRFSRATDGNVAVIFTFAILPILAFVGAAVDYTRANNARTAMQAALDSTALMLSKDLTMGNITAAQIPSKAQTYFNSLFTNKDGKGISVSATYTTPTSSAAATILLSGSGYINTYFMKFADLSGGNFQKVNFGTSTTTTWGNVKMRVALALDNTGSMSQNGKITALRNAVAGTGGLIDQLSALSKNNGDVYISVIPFAKVVNLGASNYGQNYIDWTDWLNPPTTQPANSNGGFQATLPINWHAVGPGAKCPFTNSIGNTNGAANGSFVCKTGPTASDGSTTSTIPSTTITLNGATVKNPICPTAETFTAPYTFVKYNGCWSSEPTGLTETFCSGSSNCSCPKNSSGSNVTGCTCTGTGSSKSCTGLTYVHNWTQPGPNDLTDNPGQPRVSAIVGFKDNTSTTNKDHIWTPNAVGVANDWRQPSTNPISTWTGCITDRTQPNDATGVLPATSDVTTLFPAYEYFENSTAYCSSSASTSLEPIIPLSYNWSALKTAVNAMQPTGGTDQSVGLAWAWQSLLVGGPLNTPAEDSNTTYNRVIILLSDGLNTEDRWPAYGDGSSQASGNPIDARQALQCQNLQNARDANGAPMYTIYTIQVNTSTPADPTSTVLKNCASSPDKFYMLTSSTQILTTFNTIGTALSKLRLAK